LQIFDTFCAIATPGAAIFNQFQGVAVHTGQ
jgi:hypothetical protein